MLARRRTSRSSGRQAAAHRQSRWARSSCVRVKISMSRYNELGQWKPFIHGGDEAFAESAAWQLAGQDVDVFSSLFYMFYTGARVLEFVVCTSVELPNQDAYFWNDKLHLWKCPRVYPL